MNPFPPFVLAMAGLVAWRAIELASFSPFLILPALLTIGAAYLVRG